MNGFSCRIPGFRARVLEWGGLLSILGGCGGWNYVKGRSCVYRIAVLTEEETSGRRLVGQISRFCRDRGMFPQISQYEDQGLFFENVRKEAPTNVVIALSGVTGLNVAEHLRSLCPTCRIIWCSDLDFSLHAFRLRADYFLLEPFSDEAFEKGLGVWLEQGRRWS